ncbi:MAG: hypothetical protein ACHQK9_15445, partial [Reyranellales bacterium]
MAARLSIVLLLLALAATGEAGAQTPAAQACTAKPTRACASALAALPPNGMAGIETLVHVVEAQLGAADLTAAALTLGQIRTAAGALADAGEHLHVLAGLAIVTTVITALDQATAGQGAEALKTMATIAEQAEESEYISLLFAETAEGHAREGRTKAAADVMAVAVTLSGAVKDDAIRRMTHNDIAVRQAAVQAQAGNVAAAEATADGLQGLLHIDAVNRIAVAGAAAQARSGQAAEALETASAIDFAPTRLQAFCILADIHDAAGRPADAAEAIRRARVTLQAMPPGTDPSDEAMAAIVRAEA